MTGPAESDVEWRSLIWNDRLAKAYAESTDPLQHGYGAVWKLASEFGDDPNVRHCWPYVAAAMEAVLAALGARVLPAGGVEREEWGIGYPGRKPWHRFLSRSDAEESLATYRESWAKSGPPSPPVELMKGTVTEWPDGSMLVGAWKAVGE